MDSWVASLINGLFRSWRCLTPQVDFSGRTLKNFRAQAYATYFGRTVAKQPQELKTPPPKNSQNAPDKSHPRAPQTDGLLHFFLVLISKHPWFWKKSFLSNPEDASSWRSDGPEKRCQVICGRVDQLPSVPCGGDKLINPIVGVYILSIISIIIIYIYIKYIHIIYIYILAIIYCIDHFLLAIIRIPY